MYLVMHSDLRESTWLPLDGQTSDYTTRPLGQFEIAKFYDLYNASITLRTTRFRRVDQDVFFFKPHNKNCATHINLCGLTVHCSIAVV
jgi:hypothetical protein